MEHKNKYYQAPAKENGVKAALVGSGPAGLTAAYYLRKGGKDVKAKELETEYDKVFYATGAWKCPVLGFDGVSDFKYPGSRIEVK